MGRMHTKIPNFCLNRIRPLARVRSPPNHVTSSTSVADQEKSDGFVNVVKKSGAMGGRKVMIVIDSSIEAKIAVQWALGHTVRNHDVLILLHVAKPRKQEQTIRRDAINPRRIPEFLTCMKNMCQLKRPEVRVEVAVVEGKEKGPAIVKEADRRKVALLILGQKKRWVTWRLMLAWAAGNRVAAGGVAEYCVQNATCMTIAVRRKSKKVGGYLITTKRHKDFWLLA